MRYYRFPDNRITKVAFFVFFFLIIFFTRSAMPASHLIGINTAQFIQFGLMCVLGTAFVIFYRKNLWEIILDKRMIIAVVSAIIMLVPMVIKRDWQLMYFSILLGVIFALFITYFFSLKEVAKYYVLIISFLAVYSLLALFVLKPLVNCGIISIQKHNYVDWYDYYFYGLAFTVELPSYYRLYGIFREPGLYQFFLIIALYLNNNIIEWDKTNTPWYINALLAVCTIITFSTNGIIELVLLIGVQYIENKYYQNKKIRNITLILGVIAFMILGYIIYKDGAIYRELRAMITKLYTKTNSSVARYGSIIVDIKLFLQNPIFGDKLATVLHAVEHNTCSSLILYAVYGVVGGTLNAAAWFSFVWKKNRKLWVNLAYAMIIFMSFNTQNLTWDIMFWLFPMMALTEKTVPWLEAKLKK